VSWDELPACELGDFTLGTVPARFRAVGDPAAGIDEAVGSLDALLELSAKQEREGQGDAPWPPHYAKAPGEPDRVAPSRARGDGSGRRVSSKPLVEIARAETREEALEGLERWKARHSSVAARLEPTDVLVDGMRGRYKLWYRIRVNLEHVPEAERPLQEPLEVDYDPWAGYEWPDRSGQLVRAPRKKAVEP